MAGVNIVRIPYKGSAAALAGLISGEAHMTISDVGLAAPHTKAGRLRALAVTSALPSALAPGLPTIAASGVPGYEAIGMTGMFAPAKTPAPIIIRLNQEILRILNQPEVKERFLNAGVEPVGGSPEQFAAAVKADIDKLGKMIKDAGIKSE
jgi:tripartite-type tricarboxylate transporter receptor subunit TctC